MHNESRGGGRAVVGCLGPDTAKRDPWRELRARDMRPSYARIGMR